MKNTSVTL